MRRSRTGKRATRPGGAVGSQLSRELDGLNPDWAEYLLWGGVEGVPPYAELPVQRVLEVVSEFVRAGWRPTCLDLGTRNGVSVPTCCRRRGR
ncbi:Imm1 family immunity protein [Saccharothrix deserti]|uniref:Imm1 family immunity protein n=1 Tax=Saccharothrix deserti TaxID=2593674 RepID=UPI003B75CC78